MVGSKCKGDVSTIRIVVYCQVDETGKIRYKCKKFNSDYYLMKFISEYAKTSNKWRVFND